jgi:sugar O-acyltransferase (sialic acid O-acetyltransferase NeuD family)
MTMIAKTPLVIVGAGETAELADEYFTHDSPYEVVAFAVEAAHLRHDAFRGRPVVPFELLERAYPPDRHMAFVAVSFTHLNRVRMRLFEATRAKGYALASYVSSRASVWPTATIGENCFVLEQNVIQHGAAIGDDVTLWSGNHVGHRAVIADHAFLCSHVVVSGFCGVGRASFLGVNVALHDKVRVGADCLVGAGATIARDLPDGSLVRGPSASAGEFTTHAFFGRQGVAL